MSQNNLYNKLPINADTVSRYLGYNVFSRENVKNVIKVTNNKAEASARRAAISAKKSKESSELSEYYSQQNANLTQEELTKLKAELESQIDGKQDSGDYALNNDLPTKVSQLENNMHYVTQQQMETAHGEIIEELSLPSQSGNAGKILSTDGENLSWKKFNIANMFDTKTFDHILVGEESFGWGLQGTYVYKEAAPERYGYPDFYAKCLEEKTAGTETQTTLGNSTITTYNNANGHIYYNISDKAIVDAYFTSTGVAWMYGIDTENECIFLPRNNWFMQMTADSSKVNRFNKAGLPNITATFSGAIRNSGGEYPTGACTFLSSPGNIGHDSVQGKYAKYGFNASLSSNVYGNSNTVQPPSLNQLLYIAVGNTESVQAIIDVTEITTSENDTLPLFTGMYFDFKPNNTGWLKAGTQQNNGGIYTSCYNTLVNCLTAANNIYNLKVIATSDMQVGTDYSEYWKVNQGEAYFITPTKIAEESTAQLYFKVANAVQNLELLDAGEVLETLADKTDIAQAAHAAMPSSKYIDLALGATTTTYTAPADGYVYLEKKAGVIGRFITLINENTKIRSEYANSDNTGTICSVLLQVRKNDVFRLEYSTTGVTNYFRFIYAEGSKED